LFLWWFKYFICYRILGYNSINSFTRSFTHRRQKTRYIFLLHLAGFITTIQMIYLVTCIAISRCERHCFIHCSIHCLFVLSHEFGFGFVFRGESPGCRLISTASMLEWLRKLIPHHSQGSSTERWSRNTLPECFTSSRGF